MADTNPPTVNRGAGEDPAPTLSISACTCATHVEQQLLELELSDEVRASILKEVAQEEERLGGDSQSVWIEVHELEPLRAACRGSNPQGSEIRFDVCIGDFESASAINRIPQSAECNVARCIQGAQLYFNINPEAGTESKVEYLGCTTSQLKLARNHTAKRSD